MGAEINDLEVDLAGVPKFSASSSVPWETGRIHFTPVNDRLGVLDVYIGGIWYLLNVFRGDRRVAECLGLEFGWHEDDPENCPSGSE